MGYDIGIDVIAKFNVDAFVRHFIIRLKDYCSQGKYQDFVSFDDQSNREGWVYWSHQPSSNGFWFSSEFVNECDWDPYSMEYLVNFVVDSSPIDSDEDLAMYINYIMQSHDDGTNTQLHNVMFSYTTYKGKEKRFDVDKALLNMNRLKDLKDKFGDDVTFVYQGTCD